MRYTFESKDSAQLSICDDNLFVFLYTFVIKFTARGHCPQDSFRFVWAPDSSCFYRLHCIVFICTAFSIHISTRARYSSNSSRHRYRKMNMTLSVSWPIKRNYDFIWSRAYLTNSASWLMSFKFRLFGEADDDLISRRIQERSMLYSRHFTKSEKQFVLSSQAPIT